MEARLGDEGTGKELESNEYTVYAVIFLRGKVETLVIFKGQK